MQRKSQRQRTSSGTKTIIQQQHCHLRSGMLGRIMHQTPITGDGDSGGEEEYEGGKSGKEGRREGKNTFRLVLSRRSPLPTFWEEEKKQG